MGGGGLKPAWKLLKISKTWVYFTSATFVRKGEKGSEGGRESDWERNVPQWLNPHCSNRNQVLDSGVNVFPCIFVGNAASTDSDLTALHALSFNETMATYACHARFTFLKPLYTNLDPCKLHFQRSFMILEQAFDILFYLFFYTTLCCSLKQKSQVK